MSKKNDWRTMSLSEILTAAQLEKLTSLINRLDNSGLDCMSPEYSKKLKAFFWEIGEQLEKKGILPDFLAYSLIAQLCGRKRKR